MSNTRARSGQVAGNIRFEGTTGITVPVGTTAGPTGRNPQPTAGEIRYNSDLNVFEGYTGTIWGSMGPYDVQSVNYFAGNDVDYEFTCDFTITNVDNVIVTLNGVQLTPNIDWKLVGTNIIRFEEADTTVNPPIDESEIIVRGFNPLTGATVPAGSISAQELATSNLGSANQILSLDSNGSLTYITVPLTQPTTLALGGVLSGTTDAAVLTYNSVGIDQLAVSPGTYGQVLATDGAGNLVFITPTVSLTTTSFPSLILTPLAAAPVNLTAGMIATANGTAWDPANKQGTVPYPVFYNGVSWNALY